MIVGFCRKYVIHAKTESKILAYFGPFILLLHIMTAGKIQQR